MSSFLDTVGGAFRKSAGLSNTPSERSNVANLNLEAFTATLSHAGRVKSDMEPKELVVPQQALFWLNAGENKQELLTSCRKNADFDSVPVIEETSSVILD